MEMAPFPFNREGVRLIDLEASFRFFAPFFLISLTNRPHLC